MIRINLLGRPRPRVRRRVPIAGTLQLALFLIAVAAAVTVLGAVYYTTQNEIAKLRAEIAQKEREKRQLDDVRRDIQMLQQRERLLLDQIQVIETLRRNQAGPVRLLEAIGDTVSRTDTLWLTAIEERSSNEIEFRGMAGSVNAVANFITNLKRSGYFENVELKESAQQPQRDGVSNFEFTLTAKFSLPAPPQAASAPASATGGRL